MNSIICFCPTSDGMVTVKMPLKIVARRFTIKKLKAHGAGPAARTAKRQDHGWRPSPSGALNYYDMKGNI
ncbi:MAG: hypothetical protein ACLQJ7_13310 [Syntrophobacteraceae bacterium]